MPVFTQSEYRKRGTKKNEQKAKSEAVAKRKEIARKRPPTVKKLFVLGFPENGLGAPRSFETVVTIGSARYSLKCIEGCVKTSETVLADYLVKQQGYIKLDEKEVDQ